MVPTFSNVKESRVLSSPEYLLLMGLWVWPTTGMHIVFENYQMPTHKPFLDPWPWLGQSDVLKVRWWLLPFAPRADSPTHTRLTGIGYEALLSYNLNSTCVLVRSQIAKFMGPKFMGPPGSCWPQMGPMLAPWTLLSGICYCTSQLVSMWFISSNPKGLIPQVVDSPTANKWPNISHRF